MNSRFWIRAATLTAVLWAQLPAAQKRSQTPAQPVDMNTASADELAAVPGLGLSRAAFLVRIRELNGPFRSVDEIRILPRLTEELLRRLRPHLKAGSADDILNSSGYEPRHGAHPPR